MKKIAQAVIGIALFISITAYGAEGPPTSVVDNLVANPISLLVIAIIVFLLFREVICWYWKINRNIALLTEIRDLLAGKENSQMGAAAAKQPDQQADKKAHEVLRHHWGNVGADEDQTN